MNTSNSRVFSILAYIPFLWLIGIFAEPERDDPTVRYHVNQGIVLTIVSLIASAAARIIALVIGIVPIFGWIAGAILSVIVGLASVLLMIMGMVNAANGRMEPLILIGGITIYK